VTFNHPNGEAASRTIKQKGGPMLVGERMSKPVITISPDMPIADALNLMKKERIRRAPIVKDGKLAGIVSDKDLLNASPSPVTTLSIWEMNYLLSKVTVSEVMTKNVMTVTEDTPIEQAARIMADNKIGGLPVMREGHVVGIITETDLFKIFLELLGAREAGVRVTALVEDKPGQLAKLAEAIAEKKGNFVAFGQFTGDNPSNKMITFKVNGLTQDEVKKAIDPVVKKILDLRV
jgi:acetoin utilization protein AcuB